MSSKQKSIRGEDVKLAEGLEREFEMMSLKEEKWASPKKMRKKGAAKPENKKRKVRLLFSNMREANQVARELSPQSRALPRK